MARAPLPPDASAWRRHTHPDGYAYGWLLLLIGFSLAFQVAAPETEAARLATIVLQGATVLAALEVSGARLWLVRAALVTIVLTIVAATGLLIGSGELGVGGGRGVGLIMALLAPAAIIAGIVRQARRAEAITLRTMFGVLCVYLLLGMAFSFAYGLISAVGEGHFFAEIPRGDQADFIYFSFATLTTTGFGDLTVTDSLGRALVITEALLGQVYLVTVVALIVANLGRPAPAR